jgi:peptidoglycan hydrolase CwlO-like protein
MKTILGIIIFVLVVILLRITFTHKELPNIDKSNEIRLQKLYDSSQNVINGLYDSVSNYKSIITSLQSYDSLLMQQYKNKKNEIEKIKKQVEESNNRIKHLNCAELESELTNRYDTTKR